MFNAKTLYARRRQRSWNQVFMGFWLVLITVGVQNAGWVRDQLKHPFVLAEQKRAAILAAKQERTAVMLTAALNRINTAAGKVPTTPPKHWVRAHFELARNIHFEAGIESFKGKLAVACVTMNRVRSWRYPNSIKGVIWQRAQFSWTFLPNYAKYRGKKGEVAFLAFAKRHAGWRHMWRESRRAAHMVLSGTYKCNTRFAGVYHYMNPDFADAGIAQQWQRSGIRPVFRIGRHVFWSRSRTIGPLASKVGG